MKLINPSIIPSGNPVLFFTATILNWQHLLKPDKYKDIIVSSMLYMSEKQRMRVGGFVIMPNHIHLLLRVCNGYLLKDVQRDFLKYTAQQIKFDLAANHPKVLERFVSTQADRGYQIWERRPLAVPLYTQDVIRQKLHYIHNNPCQEKWVLAETDLEYRYSSVRFYEYGRDTEFPFLINYMDL